MLVLVEIFCCSSGEQMSSSTKIKSILTEMAKFLSGMFSFFQVSCTQRCLAHQCQTRAFLVSNTFRYCTNLPHCLHCLLVVLACAEKRPHWWSSQGCNPVVSLFWVCQSPSMGSTTQIAADKFQEDQSYVPRLGMFPLPTSPES